MKSLLALLILVLLPIDSVALVPCWDVPASPCALPPEFTHYSVVDEGDIRTTFATERAEYRPDKTVNFYLLFENLGQSEVCVNWATTPLNAIFVLAPGCTSVADPCILESLWSYPGIINLAAGSGLKLAPGECRAYEVAWDMSERAADPGRYRIVSGLFEPTFSAFIGVFRLPSTGVSLNLTILSEVSTEESSFGMIKSVFQ